MKILWGAKFFLCPFFADAFFEVLCCGFLKCFAAGWGTKIRFAFFEMFCGGVGYQESFRCFF